MLSNREVSVSEVPLIPREVAVVLRWPSAVMPCTVMNRPLISGTAMVAAGSPNVNMSRSKASPRPPDVLSRRRVAPEHIEVYVAIELSSMSGFFIVFVVILRACFSL